MQDSLKTTKTTTVDIWAVDYKAQDGGNNRNPIYHRILRKYFDDGQKINITHNQHGKPQLQDSSIKFSVSHTKDIMVMAVTQDIEVGIDIESTTRIINNPVSLAKRFFHPQEYKHLQSNPQDFLKFWTIKEAYVKMKGLGIKYGFHNFYVKDNNTLFDIAENQGYKYCEIVLAPNYICYLAQDKKQSIIYKIDEY